MLFFFLFLVTLSTSDYTNLTYFSFLYQTTRLFGDCREAWRTHQRWTKARKTFFLCLTCRREYQLHGLQHDVTSGMDAQTNPSPDYKQLC